MGTIPSVETVVELHDRDKMTFAAIAEKFGVTRQAAHKAYKKWAEENGVKWRTRSLTPKM
jgi:predicted DNA-binding protein YlxM (UPF0122 family)